MTVYRLYKCVIALSPSYAVDKPSFQRLQPTDTLSDHIGAC